jgi:hypothetical protein
MSKERVERAKRKESKRVKRDELKKNYDAGRIKSHSSVRRERRASKEE